jgi:imidazoleglycerol-phosphate dehydratase
MAVKGMNRNAVSLARKTRETEISMTLRPDAAGEIAIATGVPFFDHMLHSMAFHGGMTLSVQASGDLAVDPHHLVEDVGLVLGMLLAEWVEANGPVERFGSASVPMDEALARVVVDVCGRPTPVLKADFPQPRAGAFDLALVREFWAALAGRAGISLHGIVEYGENAHHMVEALFKALGMALGRAYTPREGVRSTKGVLD